jgi:hypothetical protein
MVSSPRFLRGFYKASLVLSLFAVEAAVNLSPSTSLTRKKVKRSIFELLARDLLFNRLRTAHLPYLIRFPRSPKAIHTVSRLN